jgi:hypothetical protein
MNTVDTEALFSLLLMEHITVEAVYHTNPFPQVR